MKLTILGSGTCIPSINRGSSGYLLETGDKRILLDCGNGTTWKLEKAGINYLDIDYIFITHFHPDHTADLIPFLFATKYPHNKQRSKPLFLYGPKGLSRFYQNLTNLYGSWMQPDELEIYEIPEELNTDHFSVKTFKTVHTEKSIGYEILHNNKRVVYTGDTGYFERLCEISDKADIFIVECSVSNSEKNDRHLCPEEITNLLKNSSPKKTVLTHFYPSMLDLNYEKIFKDIHNTEIIIAEDLMEIEV